MIRVLRSSVHFTILGLLGAATALADDLKLQPPSGGGVVITNTPGSTERLRVNGDGGVFLPGLPSHPSPDRSLCTNTATGSVGTCPLGPDIIQVCNLVTLTCATGPETCPTDYLLEAECPIGYIRLSLVQCKEPDSQLLEATPHMNPYNRRTLGCHYTGEIDSGPFEENLAIRILCIRDVATPCFATDRAPDRPATPARKRRINSRP